jgi:MoaA/NifB/PqqE/SkfB family radical SAM enzyme
MKALVITPKNDSEFKFLADLLKKLGVSSSALNYEDLEDIGMSKLMRGIDKTKKATRTEIMKKLSA